VLVVQGIRLSCRAYDDVIAELAAIGLCGEETAIGHDFPGWGLFTMHSLTVCDVDPENPDDELSLLDGVWVRPK